MDTRSRIPILMYHSVSDSDEYGGLPPDCRPVGYRSRVEEFRGHLEAIREGGWAPVPLGDLVAAGEGSGELPPQPLVLTFDDGYADNVEAVLPLLLSAGFPAVFFLSVFRLGAPGMLSWDGVARLREAGMEVGSHGLEHGLLAGRGDGELRRELEESRRVLGERLGSPPEFFSLPRGYLPPALPRLARESGYRGMCTSRPGFNTPGSDPYRLRRFPVRSGLSRAGLATLLSGRGPGYARLFFSETLRDRLRFRHRWLGRAAR